jgi:iron complex outermembrane receptor protein
VYGEIFYRHLLGFYGGLEVLYVDAFFVNDENTEKNDSYIVANLRLGYDYAIGHWLLSPFFGIQNLFDEAYNSNVRINAAPRPSGPDGRVLESPFFEPAPDFNVYGGLAVTYRW